MNCTLCNKPIILVPSAQERAAKNGGRSRDYSALFTEHADCILDKRRIDTSALMLRLRGKSATLRNQWEGKP